MMFNVQVPRLCGFEDVRRSTTGDYFCIKCGRIMADGYVETIEASLPKRLVEQFKNQTAVPIG